MRESRFSSFSGSHHTLAVPRMPGRPVSRARASAEPLCVLSVHRCARTRRRTAFLGIEASPAPPDPQSPHEECRLRPVILQLYQSSAGRYSGRGVPIPPISPGVNKSRNGSPPPGVRCGIGSPPQPLVARHKPHGARRGAPCPSDLSRRDCAEIRVQACEVRSPPPRFERRFVRDLAR